MSIMTKLVLLGLALVLLASSVDAHGWMSSPSPRGQYRTPKRYPYEEIAPASTDPDSENFVCRSDPEMPKANWLPLRAGQSQSITLELTAKHVGDCFVYLTYDGDKPIKDMKWFKIWQQHECKNADKYDIPIPAYLPSGDHVIFRWEWYALHVFPVIEYYAQCVDATLSGVTGGALPQPQVTMPGHLPKSSGGSPNNNYWNPFGSEPMFFTGPALATQNGQPATSAPATTKPTTAPPSSATTKPTSAPATAAPATAAPATAAPATAKPTTAPPSSATTKPTDAPACAVSNYVKLAMLPDAGNWWFAARVAGHRATEVAKLEIKDSGSLTSFVAATKEWSDVWVFTPRDAALSFPLTVKASLASGSSISFIVNRLPAATIDSGATFP